MCLTMRSGKDLANKEIRFQSLSQSVQQGWGSAEMAELGTNRNEVPGRHRHQRTAALSQPWTVAALTAKRSASCSWVWPTDSRMTLTRTRRSALRIPTSSQCYRRLPGHLPPLFVTGQPSTRTGRQFTMPDTELTFCSGTAAGSCQERRYSR